MLQINLSQTFDCQVLVKDQKWLGFKIGFQQKSQNDNNQTSVKHIYEEKDSDSQQPQVVIQCARQKSQQIGEDYDYQFIIPKYLKQRNTCRSQKTHKYFFLRYFFQQEIIRLYGRNSQNKINRNLINQNLILDQLPAQNIVSQKQSKDFQSNFPLEFKNFRQKKQSLAFIKLLKEKLFKKSCHYKWDFGEAVKIKQLTLDFRKQNIKVTEINQNRIRLSSIAISKAESQSLNQKSIECLSTQQDQKVQKIIVPISTLKIDLMFLYKAMSSKQERYLSLIKVFKNYEKLEVEEFTTYNQKITRYLHFSFNKESIFFNLVQKIWKLGFQITRDGQIRQDFEQLNINKKNKQSQDLLSHSLSFKYIGPNTFQILCNANKCLKEQGLWSFLNLWENYFKQKILTIIENWEVYKLLLQQELIKFVKLILYRKEKLKQFESTFKPETTRQMKPFNQYEKNTNQSKSTAASVYSHKDKKNCLEDGSYSVLYQKIFKDIFIITQKLLERLEILQMWNQINKIKQSQKFRASTFEQTCLINKFQKQLQKIQKQQGIDGEQQNQKIIYNYITYKFTSPQNTSFVMKINNTKKSLSQYLNQDKNQQIKQRTQIINLKKIISYINHYFLPSGIRNQPNLSDIPKTKKLGYDSIQSLFSQIEQERLGETKCLSCTTFFKFNANILDQTVNSAPFKVFPSVAQMKEYESQIKDQICAMLNSGGGTILFDCVNLNEKIKVCGAKITEKNKEEYQQRFASYLDTFEPKDNLKKCINISFVPVVSENFQVENEQIIIQFYNGQDSLIKPNQSYRMRPYLQNTYVMRVRICPTNKQKVYFWNQNNDKQQKDINKSFLCTQFIGDKIKSVPLGRVSKLIKQKVKQYYIPEFFNENQKIFLKKTYNYFGHQCRIPEAGVGYQENSFEKSRIGLTIESNKNKFENMSLLIARERHLSQIRKKLKQEGIDCQIVQKFKKYNFQSAKHSAVIYHNKKFEDLLKKVLYNQKFVFNGKGLIVINITNYIKLTQRNQNFKYSAQDCKYLSVWLKQAFPDETLSIYEFRPDQKTKEYYLHSQSQQSTLLIYYVLNHYNQKAVFKNPLHLDKMSPEQKAKRFIGLKLDESY